jgi:multicomponent Na+:H+ antiporter subunit D
VLYAAFLGPELPGLQDVKEAPKSMLLAMGLLAGFAICIGLFPNLLLDTLVKPAASALMDHAQYISMVIGGL